MENFPLGLSFLIVGLGNPGKAYELTRHNIGFRVVEALAKKQGLPLRGEREFEAEMARGVIASKKVILLRPLTYMNSSGESVSRVAKYFDVPLTQVMVVSDDIAIDFGDLRMKTCGSSGGHNGLKSIELHFGTQAYARLRLGVGDRRQGHLADYVLAPFTQEEQIELPKMIERAVGALECWLQSGIVQAMQFANVSQKGKKPEQNLGE